uniref:hypothetical protein n=1 Tax=Klebsiella aerogenes TaxID=548 RepID=UPI003F553874
MTLITPQQFGAKADYNFSTKQGTDDTQAFIDAISAAIAAGYQEVYIPAGNYLVTKEINLGGINSSAREGIRLRGANWSKSQLVFKASNIDDVCISLRGAPGSHTSKAVSNINITAHGDSQNKGIGLLLNNVCFAHVDDFILSNLFVGIRLSNSGGVGGFTEFNYFKNGRLLKNNVNIQFYRNGGDPSFHGNNFDNIQNQIMPKGGVGIQVNGVSGSCYLYNQYWQMQFFGGEECTAIDLINCNTDYIGGKFTAELPLVLRADANSRWDFHGNFNSISPVSFDCPTESTTTGGRFVFANITSLQNTPMTNAANRLPDNSRFFPFTTNFADKNNNGIFPSIFNIKASNIESLGFATYNLSGNAFFFGGVAYNKGLTDFSPTFWFEHDGTRLTTVSASYNLNLSSSKSSDGDGFVFTGSSFRPKKDASVDIGNETTQFRDGYFSGRVVVANEPVSTISSGAVSTSDSGVIGQMKISPDASELYICVSENKWKKVTLTDI